MACVDAAVGDAWRARRPFRDGVLRVGGDSSAAGHWRLAGAPRFDPATGAFAGMAGIGRRVADPPPASSASDSLRQLVHELRTPATAITGFAELIGSELLGPVSPVYRDRATLIQRQGGGLAEAIADLDTAARIEGAALDARAAPVDVAPIAVQAVADLQPMALARFVGLTLAPPPAALALVDERGARRLIERLLAAAVAAAMPGEQLAAHLVAKARSVRVHVSRPRALTVDDDDRLFAIDAGQGGDDLLPLGVGFTLRLVRGLAVALGGSLTIHARAPDAAAARRRGAGRGGLTRLCRPYGRGDRIRTLRPSAPKADALPGCATPRRRPHSDSEAIAETARPASARRRPTARLCRFEAGKARRLLRWGRRGKAAS